MFRREETASGGGRNAALRGARRPGEGGTVSALGETGATATLREGSAGLADSAERHSDEERAPGGAAGTTVRGPAPFHSTQADVSSSPRAGFAAKSRFSGDSGREPRDGTMPHLPGTSYSRSELPSPNRMRSLAFSARTHGIGQEKARTSVLRWGVTRRGKLRPPSRERKASHSRAPDGQLSHEMFSRFSAIPADAFQVVVAARACRGRAGKRSGRRNSARRMPAVSSPSFPAARSRSRRRKKCPSARSRLPAAEESRRGAARAFRAKALLPSPTRAGP